MFCFWLERHCLRTIERHRRTVNKGSDSGVGETWCDSLNYCSDNTLLPLPRWVVHLPSTPMLGVAMWPTLGCQQTWWSRGLKCASVVGPAPSCFGCASQGGDGPGSSSPFSLRSGDTWSRPKICSLKQSHPAEDRSSAESQLTCRSLSMKTGVVITEYESGLFNSWHRDMGTKTPSATF